MNRPVWNLHAWDSYEDYVNVLEKYCDELEKALYNVCSEINVMATEFIPQSNYPQITANEYDEEARIEQWKEWAFKDE